jgi:hypothetical protein
MYGQINSKNVLEKVELLTTEEFELSKTFLYKKIKKKTNLT